MNSVVLSLTLMTTLIPSYCILMNKNSSSKKKSIINSLIYTLIGTLLAIIICYISYKNIDIISVGVASVISLFLNYQMMRGLINFKKVPLGIIVTLLFFFSSLSELIPILIFKLDIKNLSDTVNNLLSCYSNFVLAIILFVIYFKDLKNGIKSFFKDFGNQSDNCVKYWIIGLGIMMVSNLLISLFIPRATAGNEDAVQKMIDTTPFITAISACILAPFIEELTFRKTFLDIFKNKWTCVILSGLIFGLLHVVFSYTSLWDFFYVIPYAGLGSLFCYMDIKNKNIVSSIFMHAIHNSIIVFLSILTGMIIL